MVGSSDNNRTGGGGRSDREAAQPPGVEGQNEVLDLLESTLPPTPLKKLLAADGAAVYVLSGDDALLETVQEAGGEQYPIHVVPAWPDLLELVDSGRCRILLLDVEAVRGDLDKRITELKSRSPSLVMLVAAPRETAQQLIGLLSGRSIHRLLIKPAAAGITRLLLESAVGRYLQAREAERGEPEAAMQAPKRPPAVTSGTKWPAWVLATALVSLALGAVLVGGLPRLSVPLPGPEPESTAGGDGIPPGATQSVIDTPIAAVDTEAGVDTGAGGSADDGPSQGEAEAAPGGGAPGRTDAEAAPPAPDAEAAPPDPFAERLEQAALALEQGHIATPEGDSALDRYAAILAEDPSHGEASRRLDAIMEAVYGQAESALLAGSLDTAAAALGHIRRVRPESSRLAFLEAQLREAVEREAEAAAEAPAADEPSGSLVRTTLVDEASVDADVPARPRSESAAAPPSELDSLLAIARARLEQGQLLTPEGDSAQDYLARAAARNPNDPRVAEIRDGLASAVAAEARLVLDQGDLERAETLVDRAFQLGADRETLALLDLDVAAAREARTQQRRADALATAVSRIRQGRLVAPEDDSALSHLSALRAESPDYPGLAAAWADMIEDIVANANTAIENAEWADAEAWLDALEQTDPASATLGRLRGELEHGRTQARFLEEPAPIGILRVVERGAIAYPEEARRNEIQGWVELDFVVDEDGVPREPRIVRAEPEGWFEDAAAASIAQYRFEPFMQDGRRYERLIRVRVSFTLE